MSTTVAERDRTNIPENFKWDVTHLYADEAAWYREKDRLAAGFSGLRAFQGRLLSSAGVLADALELLFALDKDLSRMWVYAGLLADQDTRNARFQGMRQEMIQLGSEFEAESAFIVPEILRGGREAVDRLAASDGRLEIFRFYLSELLRREAHTLSEREERILADSGPLASGPATIFGMLADADFPYPTVTLSDGTLKRLDPSAYADLRALPNREDRRLVMSAFLGSIGSFSRTFGATLDGSLQRSIFYAKTRRYESTLEMMLDGPNIPTAVYHNLIEGVNRNLHTFHRYLRLRKRMLGVDELHYYDLYAPLVASARLEYTPDQARTHVLAALAPLGAEYTSVVRRAFEERWIDLLPADGKRSGAYSSGGAYDVHPYILMNFSGKYTDVGTLAHELGHAMHTYFSNKMLPYAQSAYPTFVAEVASTFNESLLIDYMLRNISDSGMRLSLLGQYVEAVRTTVFRQTQFAEFELRVHEMAERGEAIVGESVAKLYMDIVKKYYGHDEGTCTVDDYVAHEWSFVHHFYRDYYVFQYATSHTASEALAAKVKSGDEQARKRFLKFLGSGGSKHPIDLLKDAGVDMTASEPLDLAIRAMNEAMDEMERLLDRRS